MIVVCQADDPDADTLVYDWVIDGKFSIQGVGPDSSHLYNTLSNSRVFYRYAPNPIDTTAWVQCIVRDRKGGAAGRLVYVRLHM